MAYQKQEWHDLPLEDTPINADRLNYMEQGIYDAWEHGGGSSAPIGGIMSYGGTVAPNGWLICDGTAYLRTEYPDLFGVIGTAFNEENDGETVFRVPDYTNGKVPVGAGGDGAYSLGATGGEEEHTLITEELPKVTVVNKVGIITCGSGSQTLAVNSSGGQAHNNMPPYVAANYIIKALDEPTGEILSETMPIGSEIDYNGNTVPDGWEQVADPNSYSTTEVKTEKTWIDGKPIYRKVIVSNMSLSDGVNNNVEHGISNLGTITDFRGGVEGNRYIPSANANDAISLFIYDTTYLHIAANDSWSARDWFFIIEYTKTDD